MCVFVTITRALLLWQEHWHGGGRASFSVSWTKAHWFPKEKSCGVRIILCATGTEWQGGSRGTASVILKGIGQHLEMIHVRGEHLSALYT